MLGKAQVIVLQGVSKYHPPWGGGHLRLLGQGMPRVSSNSDPISRPKTQPSSRVRVGENSGNEVDQKLSFSTSIFRPGL